MVTQTFKSARAGKAKRAFSTRRVPRSAMKTLLTGMFNRSLVILCWRGSNRSEITQSWN